MRRFVFFAVLAAPLFMPARAEAQAGPYIGAGGGGTYYCIVSRCNAGTVVAAVTGIDVARNVTIEAGARRHFCFDCDNYWMGETTALVRFPLGVVAPFVGAGYGFSSDPEFFGDTRWHPHAAAGVWLETPRGWGVQLAIRGRQLSRGDRLGEAALIGTRRLRL